MQVIKQRYYMNPQVELAWRPIDPYCTQEIQYYDLTLHHAGLESKSDKYSVAHSSGFSLPYGVMFQRRKADGTIRETEIPNNVKISPDFIQDDIVASTIPLYELRIIAARYHRIKSLLFSFNETPKMEKVRLRGNWIDFGNLDMSNCKFLNYLDISMNYIDTIQLPTTGPNDSNNNFTYAYLGHYANNAPAPRQVVNALMRRAFYSNVSNSLDSAVETKRMNSQTSVGTLYYDGVNYHKLLIDRGWSIEHISTVEEVNFPSSQSGTQPLEFMTSHHNWDLVIPAGVDWLTADKSDGNYSLNVQTINLTAQANNTGAPRSTEVYLRKIKEYPRTTSNSWENGTEFLYKATIIITQP